MIKIGNKEFDFGTVYNADISVKKESVIVEARRILSKYGIYATVPLTLFDEKASPIKALKNFLYKTYGYKLDGNDLINELQIAFNRINAPQTFGVVFSPEMDWSPGDYGDRDSCYWSFNMGGRYIIGDNGGCFIKLSTNDKPKYGRLMCLPAGNANAMTFFNTYRVDDDTVASIFKELTGYDPLFHLLTNKGKRNINDRKVIYSNSSRNVILSFEDEPKEEYYWDVDERPYITYKCGICGKRFLRKDGTTCCGAESQPDASW